MPLACTALLTCNSVKNLRRWHGGQNFSSMPRASVVLDCGGSVCVDFAVRVDFGAFGSPVSSEIHAACRTLDSLIGIAGRFDVKPAWSHHLGRRGADPRLLHHARLTVGFQGSSWGFHSRVEQALISATNLTEIWPFLNP